MGRYTKLSILTVILAMIGALFATAGVAAGNTPVFGEKGRLDLHTGDSGYTVTWYKPNGMAASAKQILTIDLKCNVVGYSGPNYISIGQTGGITQGNGSGIGAVSHGLGVKTKNNCGTDQGQIVPGQTLTITPGSFFSQKVRFKSADIDIEGKRNARLGVIYTLANNTTVGYDTDLSSTSDNGPDSGPSDNNFVLLRPDFKFRSVAFYPIMGGTNSPAISVEGGGDSATLLKNPTYGTNASAFEIVEEFDGELNCGDPAQATNPAGYTSVISRLDTSNPGVTAACVTPKRYNLTATNTLVSFDPGTAITANYRADIVLDKRTVGSPPVLQYDRDISTAGPYLDMQLCKIRPAGPPENSGMFPELLSGDFPTLAGVTDTDGAPATWCLVASRSVTLGNGFELHYFVTFGNDDPGWSIR